MNKLRTAVAAVAAVAWCDSVEAGFTPVGNNTLLVPWLFRGAVLPTVSAVIGLSRLLFSPYTDGLTKGCFLCWCRLTEAPHLMQPRSTS